MALALLVVGAIAAPCLTAAQCPEPGERPWVPWDPPEPQEPTLHRCCCFSNTPYAEMSESELMGENRCCGVSTPFCNDYAIDVTIQADPYWESEMKNVPGLLPGEYEYQRVPKQRIDFTCICTPIGGGPTNSHPCTSVFVGDPDDPNAWIYIFECEECEPDP